jgi:hypothetical protein
VTDNMKQNAQDLLKNEDQMREVRESDLPIFFEQQQEPIAICRAASTAKDPADRQGFNPHWK